jgi:nucleoside-diphosphate-sugar epimerase
MKYTILGGSGFIGGHLTQYLTDQNLELDVPKRDDPEWLEKLLNSENLGTVFYCIGLTANFRRYPFETVNAHVCLLNKLLKHARMEQLIYLSSTRIYDGAKNTDESSVVNVQSHLPSHLYNLSKLMGESICINSNKKTKVIRLSNVYGPQMESDNFISSIIRDAVRIGKVKFQTSANSSKDFISIRDVVRYIFQLAIHGDGSIYNLASGKNTTNVQLYFALKQLGVDVEFEENASQWSIPEINVNKLQVEFGKPHYNLISDLPELLNSYILNKENIHE